MGSFGFGIRFCPTDEELITYYLKNKIKNQPLPWGSDGVVISRDIYGEEGTPWILFPDNDPCWQTPVDTLGKVFLDQKVLYVFTRLSGKNKGDKNKNRVAGCGQWHGNSAPKRIKKVGSGEPIGKKRTFTFKSREETQGHWTMYEYFIDGDCLEGLNNELDTSLVLCRIKRDDSKSSKGGKLVSHTSSRYGVVESNDRGVIEATKRQLEIDQIGCNKKLRISDGEQHDGLQQTKSAAKLEDSSVVDGAQIEGFQQITSGTDHGSMMDQMQSMHGEATAESIQCPAMKDREANLATTDQRIGDAFGIGEERPHFNIVLGDDIYSVPPDYDMDGRWEQCYSSPNSFCYVDPAVLPVH